MNPNKPLDQFTLPEMTDRQMMAFILFKMIRLEAEIRMVSEKIVPNKSAEDENPASNLHVLCQEQALVQHQKDADSFLAALKQSSE